MARTQEPDGSPTWPPPAAVPRPRGGDADPGQVETVHPGSVASGQDTSAVNLRFALIDQRLALISERLELVSERIQRLSDTTPSRSVVGESTLVGPKAPAAARGPKLAEGTLRPPRVPRDLEPVDTATSTHSRLHERRGASVAGPIMTGTASGISLGSVFSLLEFERCGGGLSIRGGDRHVELTVKDGNVTRCEMDGVRVSPSAALREVFTWQTCTFAFRRDEISDEEEPPQSVNALMMEAMRVIDEGRRTG